MFLSTILISLINSYCILSKSLVVEAKDSKEDSNRLNDHFKEIKSTFKLDTPFYVYEDLAFADATIYDDDGNEIKYETFLNDVYLKNQRKHSDDYWFMLSAMKHPMRVTDPKEAKLFYVPTLMNVIAATTLNRSFCYHYCVRDKCDYELFDVIDKYLDNSKWFKRKNGADHIIVASHYGFNTIWEKEDDEANLESIQFSRKVASWYRNIFNCNKVIFEHASQSDIINQDRINFPAMYVGKSCENLNNDVRNRFVFLADFGRSEERKELVAWIKKVTFTENQDLIGSHLEFCPNIGYGKYGFHVKGDSFGSSRLIDLILNGVVPIFTEQEQYNILPSWLPFKWISFYADVTSQHAFMVSLQEIIVDDSNYEMKRNAILKFKNVFDYETIVPFNMYMYHFAKEIKAKESSSEKITYY